MMFLVEFFPIECQCGALSVATFTRGIQSLEGDNEVEALQVLCRRKNMIGIQVFSFIYSLQETDDLPGAK
jgi:hypothetical protein